MKYQLESTKVSSVSVSRNASPPQPGQRTPVLLIGDRFRRWSWYVRLPGDRSHGWAGIVRCEISPDRPIAEAAAVADTCTLALPRFASEAHKDARAPQNL